MIPSSLHDVLIARQPDAELKRKQAKARRRGFWTQEDLDAARRTADHWLEFFLGEAKSATSFINRF